MRRSRQARAAEMFLSAAVSAWALAGGALLVAVVAVNVLSILGAALLGRPFPGDFEITETGIAVAVFAFLPYCQLTGANVTADVFTSRAGPRLLAFLGLAGSATALAFSALLAWRMWYGLLDQKAYGYTTTILQFPHWIAFAAILASLALLMAASAMTLLRDVRDVTSAGAR